MIPAPRPHRYLMRADEVRTDDTIIKSYGDLLVYETYDTRSGLVAILTTLPDGRLHEFRHRRATRLLVERRARPAAGR